MYKYRKFIGKKEVACFVWRDSIPSNPIAGTFYWIDSEDGTALYFTNYDSKLMRLDYQIVTENDLDDDLKNKINVITEDRLDDDLKSKINNISIDEENKLMTIIINGKNYYSTIFDSVNSPIIPSQSSMEITTNDVKTISINQNEEGVITKWLVSSSEINPIDFSNWNIGTSITITGISSSLYTTYYVYAVNIKNGICSSVSSKVYKYKRQQNAPTYYISGNNYSTSRKCTINQLEGFNIVYSSDKINWKNDLVSVNGVSLDGFNSNKEKAYIFYVKYYNELTTEDSLISSIQIIVGTSSIRYKSLNSIPDSLPDFSGWTSFESQSFNKDFKFNETFDFYPCFAVPYNRNLIATALGREITPNKKINVVVPSDGNSYVIYVLPKQSSNVDVDMNIKIS